MTTFIATIVVMPQKEILDPQGKAVALGLANLGINDVADVRIGKNIILKLSAESMVFASRKVKLACDKLLANLIMEEYTYEILEESKYILKME